MPEGHPFRQECTQTRRTSRRRKSGCSAVRITAHGGGALRCRTRQRGFRRRHRRRRRSTSTDSSISRARSVDRIGAVRVELAADTEEEARYHFASRPRFRLLRDRGIFAALRRQAALAHSYTGAETARMADTATAPSWRGPAVAERTRLTKRLNVRRWPSSPGPPTRPCGGGLSAAGRDHGVRAADRTASGDVFRDDGGFACPLSRCRHHDRFGTIAPTACRTFSAIIIVAALRLAEHRRHDGGVDHP